MGWRAVEIDQAAVLVLARQVRTTDAELVSKNRVPLREGASFVPASAGGKVHRDDRISCYGMDRQCRSRLKVIDLAAERNQLEAGRHHQDQCQDGKDRAQHVASCTGRVPLRVLWSD